MNVVSPTSLLFAVLHRLELDSGKDPVYLQERDALLFPSEDRKRISSLRVLQKFVESLSQEYYRAILNREILWKRVVSLLGAGLGVATAVGVIWLEVPDPVNVIAAFIVLVGIPLFLLLLSLLFVLPSSLHKKIPIFSAVSDLLLLLHPLRLFEVVARSSGKIPILEAFRTDAEVGVDWRPWRTWTIFLAGQLAACSFSMAAALTILVCVAISDVAFVWSTTLSVDSSSIHALFNCIASPWSDVLPAAAPSVQLVEATRYYRLQDGVAQPFIHGGWWPFLVVAIFFYGVIPRIILALFAWWRRDAAARELLESYPGVQGALLRLRQDVVRSTAAQHHDSQAPQPLEAGENLLELSVEASEVTVIFLSLREMPDLEEKLRNHYPATKFHCEFAGGRSSLAQDREIIRGLSNQSSQRVVLLVVRGWEPPTAENISFIDELSQKAHRLEVVLLPLRLPSGDARLSYVHAQVWRRSIEEGIPTSVFPKSALCSQQVK
jgi:hypothetical protein